MGWFGPTKREIWTAFAQEKGGRLVKKSMGLLTRDELQIPLKKWVLLIDTYQQNKQPTFTRIRVSYVNRDSFFFRIYRKDQRFQLPKLTGFQDVIVGYVDFDRDFIIQGNDQDKLRSMFGNQLLRKIVEWQPDIFVENKVDDTWVTDPFSEGISELNLHLVGVVKDIDRLRDLYDLIEEILFQLCQIGSAFEDRPGS